MVTAINNFPFHFGRTSLGAEKGSLFSQTTQRPEGMFPVSCPSTSRCITTDHKALSSKCS